MQKKFNSTVFSNLRDEQDSSMHGKTVHGIDTLASRSATAILPPSPAVETYRSDSGTITPGSPYSPLSAEFRSENDKNLPENQDLPTIIKNQKAQLAKAQSHNARLWALVGKQRNQIIELQQQLAPGSVENDWLEERLSDGNSYESSGDDNKPAIMEMLPDDLLDPFISRPKKTEIPPSQSQSPTALNAATIPRRNSSIASTFSSLSGISSKIVDVAVDNNELRSQTKWKNASRRGIDGVENDDSSELAELSMSILEMLNSKVPADLLATDEETRARLRTEAKLQQSYAQSKEVPSRKLSSIVIPEDISTGPEKSLNNDTPSLLDNKVGRAVHSAHLKSFRMEIVCGLIGKVGDELKSTKDNPVAILSLTLQSTNEEVSRCLKSFNQIMELDSIIRPHLHGHSLCRLPERSIFSSQAPAKVDIRNSMLNNYFATLLAIDDLPVSVQTTVVKFFSEDHIRSSPSSVNLINSASPEGSSQVVKHGFLTKRRRSFASGNLWKTVFFVLLGSNLHFFDRADGSLSGTIHITNARIGRQRAEPNKHDEEDKEFRHAFLLVEVYHDKETRHVFCAENDKERDSWIEALLSCVDSVSDKSTSEIPVSPVMPWTIYHDAEIALHESTSPLNELISSPISVKRLSDAGDDRSLEQDSIPALEELIKDPFSKSRSSSTTISRNESSDTVQKLRKRSFFSLRPRKSGSLPSESYAKKDVRVLKNGSGASSLADVTRMSMGFPDSNRPAVNSTLGTEIFGGAESNGLFGASLLSALKLSSRDIGGKKVPSILFRTTDYLRKKKAYLEEGIFRVSGSSSQIRALSTKFDEDYDLDLEKLESIDINVVCGLLKKWLMDLPDPVLTAGLTSQFRTAVESKDAAVRIIKVRELLRRLPTENFDMLMVLTGFMAVVLEHEDVNKMSIKNLSIIFSQTLNMPAAVFVSLVSDHENLFGDEVESSQMLNGEKMNAERISSEQ